MLLHRVTAVSFVPGATAEQVLLVSAGADKTLRLWDAVSRTCIRTTTKLAGDSTALVVVRCSTTPSTESLTACASCQSHPNA